jgi:glycosyltransferase involved in cell wall biosynthesis/GR25 family glycosyltransferase involved in LPS biosynthesis
MKVVIYTGYQKYPYNPETINKTGLGGTEQCVVYLAKYLKLLQPNSQFWVVGDVIEGEYDGVSYRTTERFKQEVDYVDTIIGVSYIHYIKEFEGFNYKNSLFWVHNTDYFDWWNGESIPNHEELLLDSKLKNIICLTNWHKNQFESAFPNSIGKVKVIGNAIDYSKFVNTYHKPKVVNGRTFLDPHTDLPQKHPNQYIYSSHAERGLQILLEEWPSILEQTPDATLKVATPEYGLEYFNEYYLDWVNNLDNVEFVGTLPQQELYQLMAESSYWYYPSSYEETFCITALEMLGHKVQPITWEWGGLKETLHGFNTTKTTDEVDWKFAQQYINSSTWLNRIHNKWLPLLLELNMNIDQFYVLSLNETPELVEKCNNLNLPSPTPYMIKQGFDARTMTQEDWDKFGVAKHPRWNIEGSNMWWKRDVMDGELGCGLSHVDAWVDAYSKGLETVLFLEEDFHEDILVPWDKVNQLLELGYNFIYLGRSALEASLEVEIEGVRGWVEPDYTYNSHAYILTKKGLQILVEEYMEQYKSEMFAFDEFLSITFGMTHRQDILAEYAGKTRLKAAAPTVDYFTQKDSPGLTFYNKPTTTDKPELFQTDNWEEWCNKYINPHIRKGQYKLMVDEIGPNVLHFPLFTEKFCTEVIELAEQSEWITDRHDFYPTTDQTLESLGIQDIYQRVLEEFVYPIWIWFWTLEGEGWDNLSSENFIAKYDTENQGSLDLHHDNSVITLNVRLNSDFEGGGTYLPKYKTTLQPKKIGYAMAHPGNITHLHGGRPVESGTRYILVTFTQK